MLSFLVTNTNLGGATIDATLVTPYTSTVKSLIDQVNDFLTYDAPGDSHFRKPLQTLTRSREKLLSWLVVGQQPLLHLDRHQ